MKSLRIALAVLVVAPLAHAADIDAGNAKVQAVCAACHDANDASRG